MVLPEHPLTNSTVFIRVYSTRARRFIARRGLVIMGSDARVLVRLDSGEVRSVATREIFRAEPLGPAA